MSITLQQIHKIILHNHHLHHYPQEDVEGIEEVEGTEVVEGVEEVVDADKEKEVIITIMNNLHTLVNAISLFYATKSF
jgi:hypothetical protein